VTGALGTDAHHQSLRVPHFCTYHNVGLLQGDNVARWDELYHSIAGVLNNNMWGIALAGADICGFYDMLPEHHVWSAEHALPEAEYEELCNR
jgi:alpha-glucosidase (family GH31 glycosyl hydrolase)